MPFTIRVVEPVFLCRGCDLKGVKNDLEALSVHSTCELIKQMKSINEHALSLFSELTSEIDSIVGRTNNISTRMQNIIDNSKGTKKNNEDNAAAHNWRLNIEFKQPFSKENALPETIKSLYDNCEEIPALSVFDKYRKDGKSSLKLYTNPDYALEQWILMMQQDLEVKKQRKQKVKILTKPKVSDTAAPLTNVKLQNQINQVPEWERTMSSTLKRTDVSVSNNNVSASRQSETSRTLTPKTSEVKQSSFDQKLSKQESNDQTKLLNVNIASPISINDVKPTIPSSLKSYTPSNIKNTSIPTASFNESTNFNDKSRVENTMNINEFSNIQTNTMVAETEVESQQINRKISEEKISTISLPPPPPMVDIAPPPPPPDFSVPTANPIVIPPPSSNKSRVIEIAPSPKGDLMASIRSGMNLKKVEITEKKEKNQPSGFAGDTVAAMLARRQAMQDSDSEDGSVDNDDWD